MQHFFQILIMVLTAVFAQLMHMNKLNRKFIANDQEFKNDKYWKAEKFSILATLVFIPIFCIVFPYAVVEYTISILLQFVAYALAGGIGVAGFSTFLGRSDIYLKKQINNKLGGTGDEEPKNE